jgi:hypothetical protein
VDSDPGATLHDTGRGRLVIVSSGSDLADIRLYEVTCPARSGGRCAACLLEGESPDVRWWDKRS